MSPWLYLLVVAVVGLVWARVEHRRRQASTSAVLVVQGGVSLLLFAGIGGAFVLFGWKWGRGITLAALAAGSLY